jgi:SAM-dependent methyltransferase
MRKGWLAIPGVQFGERTVKEQMLGLGPALKECRGKKVLDLGCAEGFIGQKFADSGAAHVLGLDSLQSHLDVAKQHCKRVTFRLVDLNVEPLPHVPRFDIVLALAILHKLTEPRRGVAYCAAHSKSLIVVRLPIGSNGLIVGKFSKAECDVPSAMREEGFIPERIEGGPRSEIVQYYRRVS